MFVTIIGVAHEVHRYTWAPSKGKYAILSPHKRLFAYRAAAAKGERERDRQVFEHQGIILMKLKRRCGFRSTFTVLADKHVCV